MKKCIMMTVAMLCVAAGTAQATTILGEGIGNGDFEAKEPDAVGPELYAATPNWHNAGYPGSTRTYGENINFTIDTQTYGSPQSNSRAGMPFQWRKQVNDSGYVVPAAGITFDLSYAFGRTGGKWNGDESFRTFIFTTTATVSGSFNQNGAEIVSVNYPIPQDDIYTFFETNAFYTTTASDVGKTFYFGMEMINPDGENPDGTLNLNTVVYPRVDVITWTANDGVTTPAPPSGPRISIINDDIGNGDFDGHVISGEYGWYQFTPNWHNLSGAETNNFVTTDNPAPEGAQPGSNQGLPWYDWISANDTPYVVTHTGTIFRVSYSFGRVGSNNPWSGDEEMRMILFTLNDTNAVVDADTTVGDITIIADDFYDFSQTEYYTFYESPWFYETTSADLGKKLYLGMQIHNPAGADVFPRIDVVKWQRIGGEPPDYSHLYAVDIIGGELGDGNFEDAEPAATVGGVYTPEQPFTESPNWFNANGTETEEMVFTRRNETESTRSAMIWTDRLQVNNTGYTVTSTGTVFYLSFDVYAWGGQYQGDEAVKTFMFTTDEPVDGDLIAADMNIFAEEFSYFPGSANSEHELKGYYVTTEADVGKTFYYGMEMINPTTPHSYPRVDNVKWSVVAPADPAITTLAPNPWVEYAKANGLTGGKFADSDGDGVLDVYEFAHGGNPTNPADQGMQPYMQIETDGTVSLFTRELADSSSGLNYKAEWTDNLTNENWQAVWIETNSVAAADTNYNDLVHTIDGSSHDQLFVRSRLFPTGDRPNILFIMADDLGYADVGFNGSTDIVTPELDSLADQGTVFTSAYVAHPFCGPSRMGLLAGRYPHEIGAPYNLPDASSGEYTEFGLDARETTFSTVLQSAGYYTGLVGKWHCGQAEAYHPNNRGFEEFYGFLGGGKNYFGPYIPAGGYDYEVYPQHNGVYDTSLTDEYLTDVLTDYGVSFIEEAATRHEPFFLFMSYNAPHTPLQALQSDMDVFPGLTGDRQIYAGMVYGMDRGIGRLVDALETTGQANNTLIIFLSDNGGRSLDSAANNFPLRGNKGDTSEGGFRVPMFMYWPGVIPSAVDFDYPVSALDFYPMFANLAKGIIPEGKDLDGKDILNDVINGTNPRAGEPIYTVRYRTQFDATGQTDFGIRQDNWKALKWYGSAWKLYDLDTDIHEDTDISTNSAANITVLSNMVDAAEVWAQDHISPLWFDSTDGELEWYQKGMPHYDTSFMFP